MGILLACVVGGFLGGSIVYKVHPLFAYTDLPEIGLDASAELVQEHRDAAFQFRSWNYSADFAIIGSILGLSFGAFAGGSRRLPATIVGGLVGGLLGAGLGFLGGLYVAKTILLNAEQTLAGKSRAAGRRVGTDSGRDRLVSSCHKPRRPVCTNARIRRLVSRALSSHGTLRGRFIQVPHFKPIVPGSRGRYRATLLAHRVSSRFWIDLGDWIAEPKIGAAAR